MSDIPSFKPEWNLDDPNIIGNNADLFKTINETIARIKLIKEIGLANLYEKGVLMKNPYSTVYDMVSAIKNIPIGTGLPIFLPFQKTNFYNGYFSDDGIGVLLSLPGVQNQNSIYKKILFNDLKNSFFLNCKYAYNYSLSDGRTDNKKVLLETELSNLEIGKTIFCFISYCEKQDSSVTPFSFEDDYIWEEVYSPLESIGYNSTLMKVAIYKTSSISNFKNKINFNIPINGKVAVALLYLNDYNYGDYNFIVTQNTISGDEETQILKTEEAPYIWIIQNSSEEKISSGLKEICDDSIFLYHTKDDSSLEILYDNQDLDKYLVNNASVKHILGLKIGVKE